MEATFFVSTPEEATGVTCAEDLPGECVGEPLGIDSPQAIVALAQAFVSGTRLTPLRDATCQSFPVWPLEAGVEAAILSCAEPAQEAHVERWLAALPESALDAEAWELCALIEELRSALDTRAQGEALFVLLEEKAL